jgi:hypothetical protein
MLLTSKAEEEFKNANKKMEAIIDAIPDIMIEVGLDGTFITTIPIAKIPFIMATDQFIGKKISEIVPALLM